MTNNFKKSLPRTRVWYVIFGLLLATTLGSCSVKRLAYFNDLRPDSLRMIRSAAAFTEPVIQIDDLLSVSVQTLDPTTSIVVNQSEDVQAIGASSAAATGNQIISGFLVDKDGFIHMTLLGKIEVKGLTTYQARERITSLAKKYYKDPTVQVRFANYKITVLGEVSRPATYSVPNEKVTVLDALGLAGDLTVYGKRENILVIREMEGKKELARLDMNSSDVFQSPYFYLKQNDVVYVESSSARNAANNATTMQIFSVVISALSVIFIAFRTF